MANNYKIRFLAEGFLEEAMLIFLKIPPDLIENTNSMQAVATAMRAIEERAHNCIMVGLVDKDKKNVPSYFSEFEEIFNEYALAHKRHPEKPHIIIVVDPAMEKWLMSVAENNNINPESFGLPATWKGLVKETKKESIKKHKDFKKFIDELLERTPELQKLRDWLRDLKKEALDDYTAYLPLQDLDNANSDIS